MAQQRPRTRLHRQGEFHAGQDLPFDRDQAAYLTKVLRLRTGAQIGLFNAAAGEWRVTLRVDGPRQVVGTVGAQVCVAEGPSGLTLAFAPIKKAPLEWMITKACELGIDAFQPLLTDHTHGELGRPDRLETMMAEAAEQCERCRVPTLLPVKAFADWLPKAGNLVAAVEAGQAGDIRDVTGDCTLLIGPEGGFSAAEIAALAAAATCVSLGPRILKAETAALALITGVSIARGDFTARPDFRT